MMAPLPRIDRIVAAITRDPLSSVDDITDAAFWRQSARSRLEAPAGTASAIEAPTRSQIDKLARSLRATNLDVEETLEHLAKPVPVGRPSSDVLRDLIITGFYYSYFVALPDRDPKSRAKLDARAKLSTAEYLELSPNDRLRKRGYVSTDQVRRAVERTEDRFRCYRGPGWGHHLLDKANLACVLGRQALEREAVADAAVDADKRASLDRRLGGLRLLCKMLERLERVDRQGLGNFPLPRRRRRRAAQGRRVSPDICA